MNLLSRIRIFGTHDVGWNKRSGSTKSSATDAISAESTIRPLYPFLLRRLRDDKRHAAFFEWQDNACPLLSRMAGRH